MRKDIDLYNYDGVNLIRYTSCYDIDIMDEFLAKIKNEYTTRKRIVLKNILAKFPLIGQVQGYDEITHPKIIKINSDTKNGRRTIFGNPISVDVKATAINYPLIYKLLNSIIKTGEIDFKKLSRCCMDDKKCIDHNKAKIIKEFFYLLDFQIVMHCNFEIIRGAIKNPFYIWGTLYSNAGISEILNKAEDNSTYIKSLGLVNILPPVYNKNLNTDIPLVKSK